LIGAGTGGQAQPERVWFASLLMQAAQRLRPSIVSAITAVGVPGRAIGAIDIYDRYFVMWGV
jgi:hypothetical protein